MTHTAYSAMSDWLAIIKRSKSKTTWKTYSSAVSSFKGCTKNKPLDKVTEKDYGHFVEYLKSYNPRTEKLYATIMGLFFEYLSAKGLQSINMDYIRYTRRNETRKVPKRLRKIDFPAIKEIAQRVSSIQPGKNVYVARAKTLVLFLASGGLRADEARSLKNQNLNIQKLKGTVIGKGDKEGRFIFSRQAVTALAEYRALHKIKTDYLFISHSRRHAKGFPHPIDTDTARRDVILICSILLKEAPKYKITPHQFRHYFITTMWRKTHDIVKAQELARHDNIQTTQGYVHADDEDFE